MGAEYLDEHLPLADDLFIALGEDEDLYNEVGDLIYVVDEIIHNVGTEWAVEWMDHSDRASGLSELIDSFFSLYEIINEEGNAPDELYEATRELLNILEPLQEPHLIMDDNGNIHDEGYE